MPDRALLKQEAKGILRGARVSPYLFTLVVLVISFVIGRVSDYVQWDTATRAAYEARLGIDHILNCSKITTNVSIFQRPFLKFRQWGNRFK